MTLLLLLSCTASDPLDTAVTTPTGDGGDGDGGTTPSEEGEIPGWRAEGEIAWTLDFDADAESGGYVDCGYARSWEGSQALDLGYLCPDCSMIFPGEALLYEGLSCYQQLDAEGVKLQEEAWGFSEDGRFFRSGGNTRPLSELSTIDPSTPEGAAVSWVSEYELTSGGTMTLRASGTVAWWSDPELLLPDPWPGRTEPYTCGWPQADPGALVLDYDLQIGSVFPNVRLVDQCAEKLALWDLYGRWLVLDTAQPDCGPCRSMAATAEEFVVQMAGEGIEVMVVNLLGAGLGAPFDEPDPEVYADWVDTYESSGPVLKDRGFAYALFPSFAEETTGESFGYPTWVVVDPEMRIHAVNIGFSDWESVAELIRED